MFKKRNSAMFFACFIFCISCQEDNFEDLKIVPKVYTFNVPSKIAFNFAQKAGSSNSVIPYSNSLSIINMDNKDISVEYSIFSFNSDSKVHSNLTFIENKNIDNLKINDSINNIPLQSTSTIFSGNNLIISIINFNDESNDHLFNGMYNGELNIYKPVENKDPIFIRSITCVGLIDYQGKFNFFTQDIEESNIISLNGNFNSNNLVTGSIKKNDGTILSQLTKIDTLSITQLMENKLIGNFKFNENNEERILNCKLTRKN